MENNTKEPLIGSKKGKFLYDAKQIAEICNLDNHYKDEKNPDYPERTISSGMIIEQFGGVEAIMAGLNSNPKIGILGTPDDIKER